MLKWLDGKKTIIGAVLMLSVALIDEVAVGIWGLDTPWVQPTIDTLTWVDRVGMGFIAVGLGHKQLKKENGGSRLPQ